MIQDLTTLSAVRINRLEEMWFHIEGSRLDTLEGLRQINVFIGANNAGKSRLLRAVFRSPIEQYDVSTTLIDEASSRVKRALNKHHAHFNQLTSLSELFSPPQINEIYTSNLATKILTTLRKPHLEADISILEEPVDINELHRIARNIFGNELWDNIVSVAECPPEKASLPPSEYIPILRGLRELVANDDVYEKRTIADYFADMNRQTIRLYTGQSFNRDIQEASPSKLQHFEGFLSEHFFSRQPIKINASSKRSNHLSAARDTDLEVPQSPTIKIGTSAERPISDLGDGIQAIITILVRPFLTKNPTLFFIEEPENNLHAGWQRDIIKAFLACPQHLYFINSHSNHLLEVALESEKVSLFHVINDHQTPDKDTLVTSLTNQTEILKDLRVRATSALLANCSIWVEGVTDKLYIQALMRQFAHYLDSINKIDESLALKDLKESINYVFVEYQGSNVVHWDFDGSQLDDKYKSLATSLSKCIFLIADGDIRNRKKNGESRADWLRHALKENFFLFPYKEIENGLPACAVNSVASAWLSTSKYTTNNIQFRQGELTSNALKKCNGIGAYLESLVQNPKVKADGGGVHTYFKDKSGTIKQKRKFCDDVIEYMDNHLSNAQPSNACATLLDEDHRELCRRLFNFMMTSNDLPYFIKPDDLPEMKA